MSNQSDNHKSISNRPDCLSSNHIQPASQPVTLPSYYIQPASQQASWPSNYIQPASQPASRPSNCIQRASQPTSLPSYHIQPASQPLKLGDLHISNISWKSPITSVMYSRNEQENDSFFYFYSQTMQFPARILPRLADFFPKGQNFIGPLISFCWGEHYTCSRAR